MSMRSYYIICSILASLANVSLIILFIKKLRMQLAGKAWVCIIIAYFMVFYNNLVISFLVIERPRRTIVAFLLASFFIVKAIKNFLWLIGFWIQYKDFEKLENAEKELSKYVSSDVHKVINEESFSESLVSDLKNNDFSESKKEKL